MNMIRRIFKTEYVVLAILTAVLIAAAFLLVSVTVKGNGTGDNSVWNEYYAPLETEYLAHVREYLNAEGYANPGITLTHTTDGELNRVYTLSVHHRKFDLFDEERKEAMEDALYDLGFSDERCTLNIKLI